MKVTWLGHNTWRVDTPAGVVLLDPFLDDSPTAPIASAEAEADFVVVSHGHSDHIADAAPIAKRTGATVVANFEVGNWLAAQGVAEGRVVQLNPGGGVDLPFGRVAMTPAHHSSSLPDGSYGGVACGVLLTASQPEAAAKRLYFACDTALFLDMKLIGAVGRGGDNAGAGGLDLAVVPIGDRFTMGPDDAVEAVKLLAPRHAAPCHYGTWPPIEQDAAAWAEQVRRHTAAAPFTPAIGEAIEV